MDGLIARTVGLSGLQHYFRLSNHQFSTVKPRNAAGFSHFYPGKSYNDHFGVK